MAELALAVGVVTCDRRTRSAHLFHVYEIDHGGTEWIVAADRDHAYEILARCYGDPADDAGETVERFKDAMREIPPWEIVERYDDIDDPTGPLRRKTAAQWAAELGPGHMATTEA